MPFLRAGAAALLVAAVAAAGCGRDDSAGISTTDRPNIGIKGSADTAAKDLGFPTFATKNTTRVGGGDPIADAAGVARAVYSGSTRVTRPRAVALVDQNDWRAAIAASVLMSSPIRAPILLADGNKDLPPATKDALNGLQPTGSKQAGGAQLIRVGDVPVVEGQRTTDLRGADAFALARAIDAFQAAARGTTSDRVLVVSADDPAYAMPAAAWAAKAGDPVLFTHRDSIPRDTRAAIAAHQQPKIYVLGPPSVISDKTLAGLKRLGTATRVSGRDPVSNAIAFARFVDGAFGWGVVDPGHGLVFVNAKRPADAAAAAPLSASGSYGPQLLLDDATRVPPALEGYLLDIQPGYTRDPVRGVYNHGWIIGDDGAVSEATQSRIDALLEIVPVNERGSSTQTTP
jgi:ell wall binding domain 2 (CWB2)